MTKSMKIERKKSVTVAKASLGDKDKNGKASVRLAKESVRVAKGSVSVKVSVDIEMRSNIKGDKGDNGERKWRFGRQLVERC